MGQRPEPNEYDEQATAFLEATGTEFKAEFLEHGPHFDDEKESRDIYRVALKRGGREYSFNFGQSTMASGPWALYTWKGKRVFGSDKLTDTGKKAAALLSKMNNNTKVRGRSMRPHNPDMPDCVEIKRNPDFTAPDVYDVLAVLTKDDPDTFEEFCSNFGYDTDSRKAEGVYKAVRDEFLNIERLFNSSEMDMLREIA